MLSYVSLDYTIVCSTTHVRSWVWYGGTELLYVALDLHTLIVLNVQKVI